MAEGVLVYFIAHYQRVFLTTLQMKNAGINSKTDCWTKIGTILSGSKYFYNRGKIRQTACWFVHSDSSLRKDTPPSRNVDLGYAYITEQQNYNK